MAVNFYTSDILDGMARSTSWRDMDAFKQEVFEWLADNGCRAIEDLNSAIEDHKEASEQFESEVRCLEKKVEALEDAVSELKAERGEG